MPGPWDKYTSDPNGFAIDTARPKLENADGSFSTEETIGVEYDGRYVNLPTIVNGKRLSPDEAIAAFERGENQPVGVYASQEEADRAAKARSDKIGQVRVGDGPWGKYGVPTSTDGRDPEVEAAAQKLADQMEALGGEAGAGELFGSGFTLGLKDKVSGLAGGVVSAVKGEGFGKGYEVNRRAQEIVEERARERTGALGTVAEIAGSVGSGVLAHAPQAVGAVGRTLQAAREAGTLGIAHGLGDSESDSVAGMAGDAIVGGLGGAAAGGVISGGLEIGRGAVKAGGTFMRGLNSVLDDKSGRAAKKVLDAVIADGASADQVVARMGTRNTALINTADENVLGLARAASAKPGPGRTIINKALDAQQRQSPGKIMAAVDDVLGGGDVPLNKRVADMVTTRSNLGKGAYERAFEKNFEKGHSMVFDDLAKRVPADAVRNAQRIAQAEGRDFGEQLIASIDDVGGVTFRRAPSLREWHYIQRGLRSAKDAAYRNGVGEVGTAYNDLHKSLLQAMDEASPLYSKARKQYAAQSDMIDAIQRGREILSPQTTKNVDALTDELATLSKAEKDMVRIGLARQIKDMVEATPAAAGDMVKKFFGTKAKRDAMRAVFDSDSAFRKFEAEMGRVAKETNAFRFVRTGSRTSFVDAEKADASILADAASGAADVASGGIAGASMRAVTKILRDLGGMDKEVAGEVAKLLVERDPDAVMAALTTPLKRMNNQSARAALVSKAKPLMKAISAGGGATVGGEMVATP